MINRIFCSECETYLPPEATTCPACGRARPTTEPSPIAWAVEVGGVPAGPPLSLGPDLLVPTHDADQPPQSAALHRLALADGRPAAPPLRLEAGQFISGLQTGEALETSPVSFLLATTSADPLGRAGSLLAFDAGGRELWRWQPGVQDVSTPALAGETVWVTTNTALLAGLNLADGAEQVRISLGATPSRATVALAGNVAYVSTRGPRLLASGLDGQPRWHFAAPSGWLDQTPVIVGERLFAVVRPAGLVVALERATGRLIWQADLGSQVGKRLSPPAADAERLYVGAGDGIYAFDLADGRQAWHFATKRRIDAAPVLSEGLVYAAGYDRTLYALDAASGELDWSAPAAQERVEAVPPLVVAEPPLIVVVDRKGQITALTRPLSPEQHQAAGRWLDAAAGYAAQGDLARAADLLQAHGESCKAAQLWQAAGRLETAAQQYEAAGRWSPAAELWDQLDRPLAQAEALEKQARALASQPAGETEQAHAWEAAAAAFDSSGETGRADSCRREVARLRRLPYLTVTVDHDRLVVGRWTRLKFSISNQGGGPSRNLIVRARGGQFEGQVAETRQIMSLRPGRTRLDWLDLRPLAPGDSVPLRVTIEYQDQAGGAGAWHRTLYLPVAETLKTEEKNMAGIPAQLFNRIRQALLDCGPFDTDRQLRAVFADSRLSPWRHNLPQADSLTGRVDALIDFLHTKQRGDTRANALVLFLQVLSERLDPGDACHHRLKELAAELAAALGESPAAPSASRGLVYGDAGRQANDPPSPIRERWALLVGINHYIDPTFAPLNFCVNDVLALQQTLTGLGYKVLALHDGAGEARLQPTKDNVEAELAAVVAAVGPDDLVWVHFAGHGQLLGGQPVLITQQTRARTLASSGLPLAQVEVQLKASPASRLVLTLDACHVGVDVGRGGSDPEFNHHVYDQAQGFALIAASTTQQKAQEWREQQHGVFSYYLLQGLSGQADRAGKQFVTVDDLKDYVLNELRIWNPLHGGLLQEPTARTEGLGSMILADYRPR